MVFRDLTQVLESAGQAFVQMLQAQDVRLKEERKTSLPISSSLFLNLTPKQEAPPWPCPLSVQVKGQALLQLVPFTAQWVARS